MSSSQSWRDLPWTYWPIAFVALILVMAVSVAISVTVGINPYVGALVGGALYTYRETWVTARRENRG